MTNPTPKPSTTPPTSSVDWDAINAKWDATLKQTPLQLVEKHLKAHRDNNSDAAVIQALSLLWSDMWYIHGGGHEKMKEKK